MSAITANQQDMKRSGGRRLILLQRISPGDSSWVRACKKALTSKSSERLIRLNRRNCGPLKGKQSDSVSARISLSSTGCDVFRQSIRCVDSLAKSNRPSWWPEVTTSPAMRLSSLVV
ncbi:hypothetical protein D3C85_1616060 [compost metagenome]